MRKTDAAMTKRQLTRTRSSNDGLMDAMRRLGAVVASLVFVVVLSGCDTTDSYFRHGIGTNLYTNDIVQTTQYQEVYLTELCRQALPLISTTEAQCLNAQFGSDDWYLLVQAGLNDVDRRCDSYLAWLDDRRRTNTAVLKEIGDLTVASQAIMRVSGVSANPITLAGLAFGLAADTFININSRLLLEIDKTTVQTLVLRRRGDYRVGLQSVRIANKPAAIHAMRSYLSICTPFTIETDINATIMVYQQVGAGGLDHKGPLVGPRTIPAPRADRPIVVTSGPPRPAPNVLTGIEKTMGLDQARSIQRILCVEDTGDFGQEGSPTRKAMIDFMTAADVRGANSGRIENEAQLEALTRATRNIQSCTDQKLANAFESGIFSRFGSDSVRSRIQKAIDKVNSRLTGNKIAKPPALVSPAPGSPMGDSIRASVTALRTAYASSNGIAAGSSIDPQLWKLITRDALAE